MLRNLKVGTKLLVILLAPMLVIVALVGVGVRDRRDAASAASRVEELSSFALIGNDLQAQLESEQLHTAVVSASDDAVGRTELDEQRLRTDAALARYEGALDQLDRGSPNGSLARSIGLVETRLGNLRNIRGSVDSGPTEPYAIGEIYGDVASAVVGVNATLAGEAQDRDLLRGLDGMSRVEQLRAAMSDEATLLIGAAQTGAFTDRSGVVCNDVDADCEAFARAEQAAQGYSRAQESMSLSGATPDQKQAVVNAAGLSAYLGMARDLRTDGQQDNQLAVSGADALATGVAALDGLTAAGTDLTQQIVDQARAQEQDASRSVMLYLLAGAGGLAVALAIAVVVSRSITGPLSRLTRAADRLSNEQLPALVQQLRNPDDEAAEAVAETLTPIDVGSHDEIGDLADAFNSIQAVTVDVAEEQGRLLRKGIGDIFVNLARRNQSLLDRQIEFIDHLESNERDPDQLENLFKLDHLATRMRRNAESLLVMAGADPPRRRGAPVPVSDVVRVAIGEVEDYQRVHLLALDDATVAANVAADLAHLLSELMENATNASPPHTSVEVLGGYDTRNGYVLTIADRGIGMSEAQLADANHHLAHPPMVGLVISRSLGLTVAGRLAARYGLAVRLDARPEGGVVATVELPYGLVEYPGEEAEPAPTAMEVMASVGGRSTRGRRANRATNPAAASTSSAPDGAAPPTSVPPSASPPQSPPPSSPPPAPTPAPLVATPAGLPRRGSNGAATSAPAATPAPAPAASPTRAAGPAPTGAPGSAPPAVTAPSREPAPAPAGASSLTAAGLVRRTPASRPVDSGPESGAGRPVAASSRSPEEVRRMLSRYRSGLDRGRSDPGAVTPTTPNEGPEERA